MDLNADAVYEKLADKGVDTLYHANTVRTSCTFLKEGKLLSRGTLDEQGLDQTSQRSDEQDLKLGLWYDVFLDTRDIHEQLKRRNQYGPVLFKIDAKVLTERWLPFVSITKSNPLHWKPPEVVTPEWQQEHFLTQEEFESSYDPTSRKSSRHMLVLRRAGGVVRLSPHLKKIVVDGTASDWKPADDDNDGESNSMLLTSLGALANAARSSGVISFRDHYDVRQCPEHCDCHEEYKDMGETNQNKHFEP